VKSEKLIVKSGQFSHEGTKAPSIGTFPWCLGALVARTGKYIELSIVLFISMFVFFGCSSSKPFPEEESLLPSHKDEVYWLANFVIDGPGSTKNFARLLAVQTHSLRETFTYLHVSTNWANKSWYIQESQGTEIPALPSKQVWPMVLTIPQDSMRPEWKLYWNRKEIWLNYSTVIRSEPVSQGWRIHFPNQKPFKTSTLSSFPEILLLDPIQVQFRMVHEPEAPAWMHLTCFRHAGKAITAAGVTTTWVDLDLKSGEHLSFLAKISDSSVTLLHNRFWTNGNSEGRMLRDLDVKIPFEGYWTSPYSKKTYPLKIQLHSAEGQIDCEISTFRQEQEVLAGRQSFWMGGIEVTPTKLDYKIGAGNMYIFTH
jgi:hypothetical protein